MNTRQHPRTQPQFQLRNAVLLMAIAAAYPASVQAAGTAGVAQFAVGDVSLRRADGKTDALVKGKDIGSGEAIVTGPTGRAQVKFTDGGLVSLQPNTEFKVANYVDQADPKEDRFLVDLLRGSMRAITGLIGKRNRDNYKVTTTTATIGIRGSGFNAGYNPDGTLGVTTEFDGIEVCNAAGCVGLTAGESVVVVNNTTLPVRTNTRAEVPTPETKQEAVVAGNQTSETGVSAVVPPAPAPAPTPSPSPAPAPVTRRLLTGVAFTSVGVAKLGEDSTIDQRSSVNGALVVGDGVNAANIAQPTAYTSDTAFVGTGTSSAPRTLISSTGSLEAGDYLALGTWGGTTWVTPSGESVTVGATTFAAGSPSPLMAISALNGMRASYALKNATPIFSESGDTGTLLPSSRLNVDFSGTKNYADINLDVSMASQIAYNLRGGVTGTGAGFGGTLAVSGSGCAGSGVYCDFGTVAGTFSGANAQNALLSFGGYSDASGIFGGAATFARGTVQATPSNNTLTDLTIGLTDGGVNFQYQEFASYPSYATVKPSFYGEKLLSLTEESPYYGTTTLRNSEPTTGGFGALGVISDADFLGWGNWVAGSKDYLSAGGYGSATSSLLNSIHYIVGRPTPTAGMPTSGIATYSLVGGTVPTATLNNVSTAGQLVGADLTANFNTARMDVNIAAQFGATAVAISENVYLSRGNANFSGSSVNGFFTGNQAMRAGVVYNKIDATLGAISGAAAFQRSSFTGGTTVVTGTSPVQ